MNKAEYKDIISHNEKKLSVIHDIIHKAKKEFKEAEIVRLGVKIGDRFTLRGIKVYVVDFKLARYAGDELVAILYKVKKDGTEGKNAFDTYGYGVSSLLENGIKE